MVLVQALDTGMIRHTVVDQLGIESQCYRSVTVDTEIQCERPGSYLNNVSRSVPVIIIYITLLY